VKTILAATLGACVLGPVAVAGVQDPAPAQSPAPPAAPAEAPAEAPAATPMPAPTPHPALAGRGYDTLRDLARALDTEMQHALTGAEKAPQGLRAMRILNSNVRMFARRIRSFQTRVEGYRATPFDVAGEVATLSRRTQMLSRRLKRMGVFEHTYEDWDLMVDLLGRMDTVLAGQSVSVPRAHTPRPIPTGVPPLLRRMPGGGGEGRGVMGPQGMPRPAGSPAPAPASTPSPTPSPLPR
jgi:hypothetical protein